MSHAQIFFKKVYPDTNFAEFFCFKKIKAEGGFAFKISRFHFLFQSWCLGGEENFCFGVPRIRNGGKQSIL